MAASLRTKITSSISQPDPALLLKRLRDHVGRYAYEQLRLGRATLHRWRGTSPHNWWVAGIRGAQLWHNDSTTWGDVPPLALFQLLSESRERVPHHVLHRDGAMAFETVYCLRPEFERTAGTAPHDPGCKLMGKHGRVRA